MGLEAISLAVMSSLHLTGTLAGGGLENDAGIAEALICVALTAGAIALADARTAARTVALGAVAFAILGFGVGLRFTVAGGDAVGIAYHATVLPLLVLTMAALLRNHNAGDQAPGPRAAPEAPQR